MKQHICLPEIKVLAFQRVKKKVNIVVHINALKLLFKNLC